MRRKVLAPIVRSIVEQLEARTLLSSTFSANAGTGSISGIVYNDVNGNGVQDVGEPAVAGTTVNLEQGTATTNFTTVGTVQADINGAFSFTALAPGEYFVVLAPDTGFKQDNPQSFLVSIAPNVAASVTIGETTNPIDGGSGTASIVGTVFNDVNQDGIYNTTIEDFLAGDTVYLDLDGSGVLSPNDPTAVTNNTGQYTFNQVAPGDYLVRVVPRPGFHQDPPGYSQTLIYSDQTLTQNIGENNRSTISGVVFQDINGDGKQEAGDLTVGGETVFLDTNFDGLPEPGIQDPSTGLWNTDPATGGNEPFAVTDQTGHYVFTGLQPGTYRVIVESAAGLFQDTPGYIDVTLSQGQDLNLNVPEGIGSTVSGTVYDDRNANGVRDINEPALANQTVFLDINGDGVNETVGLGDDGLPLRPIGTLTTYNVSDQMLTPVTSDGLESELDFLVPGQLALITLVPGTTDEVASITATTPPTTTNKILGTGIYGTIVAVTPELGAPYAGTITIQADEPSAVTDANGNFSFTGLGPGTYTMHLITPTGGVPTGPSNATHSYTFTVGNGQTIAGDDFGFQTPDLTATVVNFSNKPTLTNVAKHAMVRITNVGSLPVNGLAGVNLWLSTTNGPVDTTSSYMVAEFKGKSVHLAVGQSKVFNVPYRYPLQLPLNTYYLSAQVVSNVNDNNSSNDFSAPVGPIKIGPPYIDLALTYSVQPQLIVDPGQPASVDLLLSNNGNVTNKGTVTFRFYLSPDAAIDPNAMVVQSFTFSNLHIKPGASRVVGLSLPIPEQTLGFQFINVVVVSTDPLGESNLTNNVAIEPMPTRFD